MTKLESVGAVREREKHLEIGALLFNSLTHTHVTSKKDVSFAYPKIRNKK